MVRVRSALKWLLPWRARLLGRRLVQGIYDIFRLRAL